MPTSLAHKLRVTEHRSLLLLNAPDGIAATLDPLPPGATLTTQPASATTSAHDIVILFTRDQAELERDFAAAIAATAPGGILWVAWPKGQPKGAKGTITRDTIWPFTQTLGWGPVSNVALDATWSALRLRPEAEVKRTASHLG